MASNEHQPQFHSALAPLMEQFVQTKHACGYRFGEGSRILRCFDRYLCAEGLLRCELPRSLTRQWLAKHPHESATTQQGRISLVRQFARYLCRLGYAALRHLIMPEVLRLLYGCGCRVSEVLHLRVTDVDLDRGILTVRDAKFGKDRLVPPAVPLVQRLQRYAARMGPRPPDAFFFPSPTGGPWNLGSVYWLYRELLLQCGIPHAGRGKGPRVHDLRHTMAVHTLLRWYREGADLDAKLPVLATYLGHQSLAGTQRYLHLIAELFPEITARANAGFGDVIPRRSAS
jgi:integrase/recombinase XerD